MWVVAHISLWVKDLPSGDADYCGRLESQPPHVEVISYLKIGVIE
jgi:hypothetical protein